MGGIKVKVHPLFIVLGVYYAFTKNVLVFAVYTLTAIIHELGHSLVASSLGYKLNKLTLMPFGAVISGDLNGLKSKEQIKIALAGPIINIVIGLFFVALWWLVPEIYAFTDIIVEANFSLGFINLLPIHSLDGGRVLLSLLRLKFNSETALKINRGIGVVFFVLLIGAFIYTVFNTVNFSILLFAVFILGGVLNKDEENVYVKALSTISYARLKRGVRIKRIALDKSVTVYKMIRYLDDECINEVVVYDNLTPIAVFSQEKINKIILNGSIYAEIGKFAYVK